MNLNNSKKQRRLQGVVTSDKMHKTRVVSVTRLARHPKYHQYYKVTKRFKVHDEANSYRLGDRVTIMETRPISKSKRWRILGFVKKSKPSGE